jgi:hypothetical protein
MKDPDYAEIPGEPYEWLDEWTASNRLPTHVLVSIAIKPKSKKEDPLAYTRLVELPMASLSWNPIQTSGASSTESTRRKNTTNHDNNRPPGGRK